MPVYRLDPSNPGHPSWLNSVEKDTVWVCAPSIRDARDLVAAKTTPPTPPTPPSATTGTSGSSPWQDETATSCVADPTVTSLGDGDVVRQDGSLVD